MRKLLIVLALVFSILVSFSSVGSGAGFNSNVKSAFPNVKLVFSDGKNYTISGKYWGATILPYIEGRIHGYNWESDGRAKYIFFDKTLKGLNSYGMDFIRAVEQYTVEEFEKHPFEILGEALEKTANLDSDHDGYPNMVELSNGTLPGFADSHPGAGKKTTWETYSGYIIITILVISIFVLYFVFNKLSEKEKL